jgi:uncharacterized caspase-like protein
MTVRVAIAIILSVLVVSAAEGQSRFAVLIGNQGYGSEIGRLANPHNDIALLEQSLKGLAFDVATVRDAGLTALHQAVNSHVRRVRAAGGDAIGFFYYCGHGAQHKKGKVVGAGVLPLGVDDLIALLPTVEVHNASSDAEKLAVIIRFGRLFLGELWDSYTRFIPGLP